MRWLMVEDEMIEREGLKKMVMEEFSEVELIGEAETGLEAIELAKEHNPDFITMDIKMPGMNGVDAVKEIKAWNADIEIIMMTAYNEFEYAREVMRQGVQEYILKPAKKKELYEIFARVIEVINRKKKREVSQMDDTKAVLSVIQSDWMQAYFTERVMEHYPEQLSSFFPEAKGKGCAMIIRLGEDKKSQKQHQWLKLKFEEKTNCLVGPVQSDHFPVWIFAFKDLEVLSNITKWIRRILQSFQSQFHQKITIGWGTFYDDPNHLIDSYHEAVIALALVNSEKGYIHFEEAKSQFTSGTFNRVVQEKKIYEAVRSGDSDFAVQQFEQLWPMLEDETEAKISSCKDLIHAIYGIVKEIGMTENRLFINFPDETKEREWRKWSVEQIAHAADLIRSWKHVTSKDAIWKAETWIKAHFDQPITLEETADHVSLSPYYFSKLFKDRLDKSFIDYVTDIRINKAKEWLTTTDKPLKEISALVGYKDPNYFSRVFKKITKQTLTDYRDPT